MARKDTMLCNFSHEVIVIKKQQADHSNDEKCHTSCLKSKKSTIIDLEGKYLKLQRNFKKINKEHTIKQGLTWGWGEERRGKLQCLVIPVQTH